MPSQNLNEDRRMIIECITGSYSIFNMIKDVIECDYVTEISSRHMQCI